jgi:hypothetical protein
MSLIVTALVGGSKMISNVRWMIQIPRLFAEYKKAGLLSNFQQMIDSQFFFDSAPLDLT